MGAYALPLGSLPTCCAVGADGSWIASAAGKGVFICGAAASPLVAPAVAHQADIIYAISTAPAGVYAARRLTLCASRAGPVSLVDHDAAAVIATLSARVSGEFSPLFSCTWSLSHAGRAWCGGDGVIHEFDVARGCAVSSIRGGAAHAPCRGRIAAIASSPDASGMLASGSLDGPSATVFDERSGRCLCTFEDLLDDSNAAHKGGVTCIRFSPCGRFLYAGFRRHGAIVEWDLRGTQRVLRRYARDDSSGQRLGFDVDARGGTLATPSRDGSVLIYDIASGELSLDMREWPAPPTDVAFLERGPLCVLSGPRHGTIPEPHEAHAAASLSVWAPSGIAATHIELSR